MLAVTLSITPMYACIALLAFGIFSTWKACRRDETRGSAGVWPVGIVIAFIGAIACVGWSEYHDRQEQINGMGQWTQLYRLVEDQHPVTQDIAVTAFLAANTDLEQMTAKDFTRLMNETDGIGAGDLIGFVEAPEITTEEVPQTKEN